jgi:hypothetical protein
MGEDSDDPLAPANVAAAVAPIIDRLRIAIAHRMRDSPAAEELAQRHSVPFRHVATFAMLRHLVPDRAVPVDDVLRMFIYDDERAVSQGLDRLASAGLVDVCDGALRTTSAGNDFLRGLYRLLEAAVDEMWNAHPSIIARVGPLVTEAALAATATGGAAFRVLMPQYVRPGASAGIVLAEQLTALRFHRFDAHISAWQAAGLSKIDIQALGEGSEREAIEVDTNRRAASPFAALGRRDRFDIIAALGALPN